jgi:hypothetical protein
MPIMYTSLGYWIIKKFDGFLDEDNFVLPYIYHLLFWFSKNMEEEKWEGYILAYIQNKF